MSTVANKKVETFESKRFPFLISIQRDRHILVNSHWHEHLELIKIVQGPVWLQIDQHSFRAETDEIYFINSCQVHSVTSFRGVNCVILGMVFDKTLLFSQENMEMKHLVSLFLRSDKVENKYTKTHPIWADLNNEMDKAYQEYTLEEAGHEYCILSSVYRVIFPILRLYKQELNSSPPQHYASHYMRLKPAIDYMEEHLADKVYMDTVCEKVNLSLNYFSILFKKVFGMPPVQYMTQLRMNRAKRLLLDEGKSVTEIAELCGFCNINYFDKVFKEKNGFSPMEFRKRFVHPS
ncbi:HTH-type transcriptional activator RhaR [Paenibacillus solanacearum]|uniref:HTH-type transcriptional activator RhaR n=1 Tax=Paenibacillus solanacearum TaxID=2048548 RepID=A0A916K8X3_9BACL|nr:AraC family transcriptional regulator [Paenibacillus solanacearum]CAG7646250.1 HTH-type transcriptional activator RhaR [Paenibacillus solanacearum]